MFSPVFQRPCHSPTPAIPLDSHPQQGRVRTVNAVFSDDLACLQTLAHEHSKAIYIQFFSQKIPTHIEHARKTKQTRTKITTQFVALSSKIPPNVCPVTQTVHAHFICTLSGKNDAPEYKVIAKSSADPKIPDPQILRKALTLSLPAFPASQAP